MKELQIKIIDARGLNLICSFGTFVNEELHKLSENPNVTDVKLAGVYPDYIVISYYISIHSEEVSSEDDYKPP